MDGIEVERTIDQPKRKMSFYDILGFLSFVTLVFLGVFALIRDGAVVKEVFECEADQLEQILLDQEKRINAKLDKLLEMMSEMKQQNSETDKGVISEDALLKYLNDPKIKERLQPVLDYLKDK